jgi:hypothetical protein
VKLGEADAPIPGTFKDFYHVLGDELVHIEVQGTYTRNPFRSEEFIRGHRRRQLSGKVGV